MNATLLCPGPSLAGFQRERASGMVVGVNRAATQYPCDVWAATDRTLIDRVNPVGVPVLFTISATRASLKRHGRPWPYLVVTHDGIAGGVVTNAKHPWTKYTACAALAYLAWAGAEQVDCWGVDWAGRADWDGSHHRTDNRTTQRWDEERRIWEDTIEQTGLKVIRHGLDG